MAVRGDKTSYWTLRVQGDGGATSYIDRSINHMNPGLTDDNALSYGNRFAALQTRTLQAVRRTDRATLTAE